MIWHCQILSADDKAIMQHGTVNTMTERLIEQFKPPYSETLARMKRARFGIQDINSRHSIQLFTQQLARDAKACDINQQGQLQAAYQAFDGTIQSLLTEPDEFTTIDSYMNQIRSRELAMRKIAQEHRSNAARRNPLPGWSPAQQASPQFLSRPPSQLQRPQRQQYNSRYSYQNRGRYQYQNNQNFNNNQSR
ncbi:hypothetical protein HZS61_007901 [Fusarium oxysporum f. sp. conglutinans]|uniref:Uncharacterized protein n=3 Tax=Fusarium oxysporum TaxID=5507 RepID=A0A8H6LPF1_FUSOX|nr:hypothetical protein HZS61_007901 [Fusarium oxysporum f. sp. conglutinans]KAG7001057.1 hypothetical protein FocnCong_v013380 [Fusarium oxysporum f. sp. conglutinans]